MNAFVLVKRNETKDLVLKFSQKVLRILTPGIYFFPFLWWWGDVGSYEQKEKEVSFIHFDGRKVFRTRRLVGRAGFWEDVSREFIVPFLLRKSIWVIVICLIGGYLLAKVSIRIKSKFFSNRETVFNKKSNTKNNTVTYNSSEKDTKQHSAFKEQVQSSLLSPSQDDSASADTKEATSIVINRAKNLRASDSLRQKRIIAQLVKKLEEENKKKQDQEDENRERVRILERKVKSLERQRNQSIPADISKKSNNNIIERSSEENFLEKRNRENDFVAQDIRVNPSKYNRVVGKSYDGYHFIIYDPSQKSSYLARNALDVRNTLANHGWMRMISILNNLYFLDLLDGTRLWFSTSSEVYDYAIQNGYIVNIYTVWRK